MHDPWPKPVQDYLHQEYNVKRKPMLDVIHGIKRKFPEVKDRVTKDRLRALARLIAKKNGMKRQPTIQKSKRKSQKARSNMSEGFPTEKVINSTSQPVTAIARPMVYNLRTAPQELKKEILDRAKEYREHGFRCSEISGLLAKEYKNVKIPPAAPLGRLIKDAVHGKSAKLTKKNAFDLNISGPGIEWAMKVSKDKVMRIVAILLGE
jgi:hypothetical protein